LTVYNSTDSLPQNCTTATSSNSTTTRIQTSTQ
jgi:hypothetical protein